MQVFLATIKFATLHTHTTYVFIEALKLWYLNIPGVFLLNAGLLQSIPLYEHAQLTRPSPLVILLSRLYILLLIPRNAAVSIPVMSSCVSESSSELLNECVFICIGKPLIVSMIAFSRKVFRCLAFLANTEHIPDVPNDTLRAGNTAPRDGPFYCLQSLLMVKDVQLSRSTYDTKSSEKIERVSWSQPCS